MMRAIDEGKFIKKEEINMVKYISLETRRKLRESHLGKHLSEETKQKMSESQKKRFQAMTKHPLKGRHLPKFTRIRMSRALKGHAALSFVMSDETKRKISRTTTGVPKTEKHKRNMSKARMGGKNSKQCRLNISNALKGRSLSIEHRLNISRGCLKGHDAKSPLILRLRHNWKYRQWRSDIFTRDNFTCQKCGHRGRILNAHHLESLADLMIINDIKTLKQALECEELWNLNNGVTLCMRCHHLRGLHG